MLLSWWHKRCERNLRRKVAHLRAESVAASARADQVQHSLDHEAAINGLIYNRMLEDRETAARSLSLANHYAEEVP